MDLHLNFILSIVRSTKEGNTTSLNTAHFKDDRSRVKDNKGAHILLQRFLIKNVVLSSNGQ